MAAQAMPSRKKRFRLSQHAAAKLLGPASASLLRWLDVWVKHAEQRWVLVEVQQGLLGQGAGDDDG
jgi:hypothetical protein